MHEIANELLDAALEQGDVDLVQALTYPLPVTVIAEIIGMPAEDREQFKRLVGRGRREPRHRCSSRRSIAERAQRQLALRR